MEASRPLEKSAAQRQGPEAARLRLIQGKHLTSAEAAAWRSLQATNPELSSPCFSPEFTQAVAAVRQDVEVGFIEERGQVVAIFPFQRRSLARSVPVAAIVSDYQGVICRRNYQGDPLEWLRACRLASWDFDRALASQSIFAPYCKLWEPSAQIDLSQGYDYYAEERRAAGTKQLRRCEYLMRRLARDVGPLRFVAHSNDPSELASVLAWKSRQYLRSGWKDLFRGGWATALVKRVQLAQTPDFAGMLSLLYAGDRLVAGHMGMRSRSVWHYWFPAYDREFARYSPGVLLLLKMAQHADQLGLSRIDLGTGISLYKKRFMNTSIPVAEGSIERPSALGAFRAMRRRVGAVLRSLNCGSWRMHNDHATSMP
jgi:CelD/BcsL family acetyltransferase involved in cellulose biosynthesis